MFFEELQSNNVYPYYHGWALPPIFREKGSKAIFPVELISNTV